MDKSFSDIIIAHLRDLHISELRKIQYAILSILTNPNELLSKAKEIKLQRGTLHAVKFLKDAEYPGGLRELKETVDSL